MIAPSQLLKPTAPMCCHIHSTHVECRHKRKHLYFLSEKPSKSFHTIFTHYNQISLIYKAFGTIPCPDHRYHRMKDFNDYVGVFFVFKNNKAHSAKKQNGLFKWKTCITFI